MRTYLCRINQHLLLGRNVHAAPLKCIFSDNLGDFLGTRGVLIIEFGAGQLNPDVLTTTPLLLTALLSYHEPN